MKAIKARTAAPGSWPDGAGTGDDIDLPGETSRLARLVLAPVRHARTCALTVKPPQLDPTTRSQVEVRLVVDRNAHGLGCAHANAKRPGVGFIAQYTRCAHSAGCAVAVVYANVVQADVVTPGDEAEPRATQAVFPQLN